MSKLKSPLMLFFVTLLVIVLIALLGPEGIQRKHVPLHARQVASAAGMSGELIERVAARLFTEKAVRIDRAEEIIKELTA